MNACPREYSLKMGFDYYLTKLVNVEEVSAVLNEQKYAERREGFSSTPRWL